jgi:peptidoglycan/LPS O-acetylase OafA/YrhL
MTPSEEKAAVRARLIAARTALTEADRTKRDEALCDILAASPLLSHASCVLLYAAVRGEIDLAPVAKALAEKGIPLARAAAALCLPVGAIHAWLSYRQTVGGIGYCLYGTVNFIYATLATVAVFGICIRSIVRAPRLSLSRPVAAGSYGIYLYHLMAIFVLQYDVLPHFTSNVGLCYLCLALGVSGGILIYLRLTERLLRSKSREKA